MSGAGQALPFLVLATTLAIATTLLRARRPRLATAIAIVGAALSAVLLAAYGLPDAPSADDSARASAALLVLLLTTWPAGAVIGWTLALLRLAPPPPFGDARAGLVIGCMERLLIVVLYPLGGAQAVALVFAAKQLVRYPAIQQAQRDADQGPVGESGSGAAGVDYLLVGSLLSLLVGLVGGLAVDALLS